MLDNNDKTQQEQPEPRQQIIAEAEQGSPFAQLAAADMYYSQGEYDDAFCWYSLAVTAFITQRGSYSNDVIQHEIPAAECRLADMYFNGLGTDTDKLMAFELYSQAARKHYHKAQVQLGMMYVYGEGVHQHYGLGYAWLNAAQLNGDNCKDVQKVKKMVEKKFDRAALDNARKMSEQWVDEATLAQLAQQKKTRFAFISNWFKK